MPRFSYEDADKYGSSGGRGSFFQLKDDGDKAFVHLLGDSMNDFPGYAVHRVQIDDKYRYVNCLREAGEPVDVCPFCALGREDPEISKVYAKLFIPLYNIDADEVQLWERGKAFFKKLSSYISHTPNASRAITEIERVGKKGDTNTDYNLYEKRDEDDGFDIANVRDDIPEIMGGVILDKTAEDMEYYLRHGDFEDTSKKDERPTRRDRREDDSRVSRRTPSSRRTAEDEY